MSTDDKKINIPDVAGKTAREAGAELRNCRLSVTDRDMNAAGIVTATTPPPPGQALTLRRW